jgi:tripartite-type tricarboxylate transporter receptor subunit TctC
VIVQMRDIKERFAGMNLEPIGSTPEAFAQLLKEDLEKYARIAKAAKIEPQ